MSELLERLAHEFGDKDYAHAYMEDFSNMRIAAQIRALRELRGLTQAQLAQMSGMKQERISALESADYDAWTIKTLRKLAQAFDTNLTLAFTPFSQGILDVVNLSREQLRVPPRTEDMEAFGKHRVIRKGGAWEAIDTGHLAPVVALEPPKAFDPGQNWQVLTKVPVYG